jgi:two-component system sensor histidine kinase DegS
MEAFAKKMKSRAAFYALMDVEFSAEIDDAANYVLPRKVETTLKTIIELAFANIRLYAKAKNASLHFEVNGTRLKIEIKDDGIGFDPENLPEGKLGVLDIKRKASELNGSCEINSAPNQGTEILISVPVQFEFDDQTDNTN